MEDHSMLGTFICQRRKELGMTQKELAGRVGVSDKAVSKWETLEANPDISLLLPLSDVLQVSVEELLKGERSEAEPPPCEEAEPSAEEEPTKPRGKSTAAYIALIVLSVILGIFTLFALISLALIGEANPEDRTALFIVFTVLLILFGTAFAFTLKRAVLCAVEINEIPTEQKEVGGYIIYKNLSREEKRALLQSRKEPSVLFWCVALCLGVGFIICWILRLFYDSMAVQICTLVFAVLILALELTETVLKAKWFHKKKIITTRRQYERLKKRGVFKFIKR